MFHLVFLSVIIVPGYRAVRYQSSEIITVKLVGEKRPAPEPRIEKPAPRKEAPPKIQPSKSKMAYKSSKKTHKTEPKQADSGKSKTPEPKKPSAEAPRSAIRVDEKDFRFGYYLEIIKERISYNWSPPPVAGTPEGIMSTVYFRISRDGRVTDLKIETGSDYDLFDRAALRAVDLSNPLPPLPSGFKGRWLGVHFEFEQTSG
jgi:colicin import membrane protein